MDKCTALLLAQFPNPSATEFWTFIISALFLAAIYYLGLRIQNERRKSREAEGNNGGERRRILPDPLRIDNVKVYVEEPIFKESIKMLREDLRREFEEKFLKHDKYVHEKFHDLANGVHDIATSHQEWRETAIDNFQQIEGKLGELKATAQHNTALAIRTDESVKRLNENLPGIVTAAVRRRT
jgi:hypothetical protein